MGETYVLEEKISSHLFYCKAKITNWPPFTIIGPQMYMFIALYFKNQKILHQNIKVKKKKQLGKKSKSEDRARLDPHFQMALIGRNKRSGGPPGAQQFGTTLPASCAVPGTSRVYVSGSSPVAI